MHIRLLAHVEKSKEKQSTMESITLPSDEIEVSSIIPRCNVRLNKEHDRLIPYGFDINQFKVIDAPEYLEKVHVYIGDSQAVTFYKEDFADQQNLFPQGFPLSQSKYFYVDVQLEYNDDYVTSHQTSELVDEYEEVIEYSDTEEEFFDGHDYHYGQRVHRSQVKTGRKVSKITKGAIVVRPQLLFELVPPPEQQSDTISRIPVWERITINPKTDDASYVERLMNQYKLQTLDDTPVLTAHEKGVPFQAKLQNLIHFSGCIAGKVFCFA